MAKHIKRAFRDALSRGLVARPAPSPIPTCPDCGECLGACCCPCPTCREDISACECEEVESGCTCVDETDVNLGGDGICRACGKRAVEVCRSCGCFENGCECEEFVPQAVPQ